MSGYKEKDKQALAQGRSRQTSILAEKIIVEDGTGMEEKSLVDTVYALRDQVSTLKQDQKKLQQSLEEESKARRRLEALIRRAAQEADKPITSTSRSTSMKESRKKPSST